MPPPKTILVIGIGAGNPDHLTVQAIEAMNRAEMFFVMDKGPAKQALAALRHRILDRFVRDRRYRVVEATMPERDRDHPDYRAAVSNLDRAKTALFGRLIADELPPGGCGAFLVWGDPSLYDGTLRVLDALRGSGGHDFDLEVIPGITSIQALAARHRTTLSRPAGTVAVTTGRLLAAHGLPDAADDVVVMLDGEQAFRRLAADPSGAEFDILWGAYLGMPEEILVSGPLRDVAADILRLRAEARAAHGWIMDAYLLRRRAAAG